MARPKTTTTSRSLRSFALLAALCALMGVAATGCGSEEEGDASKDESAQVEDGSDEAAGAAGEAGDEGSTGSEDEPEDDEGA